MTTPTDTAAVRAALVELPSTQPAPPHRHPSHPDRGRAHPAALSKQHHTHDPAARFRPPPAQRLTALTAALHTGLCEPAAVTFGWLDTLPPLPNPPLPKRTPRHDWTGPGLPDTVAAELGVDEIQVLLSRIRAAAGGRAGRLTRRRAVVGSTYCFSSSLLVALWDNRRHLRNPNGGPEHQHPGTGTISSHQPQRDPIGKFVARLRAEQGLSLTIARHKHFGRHRIGETISAGTYLKQKFSARITG